jgi:hypothetical protein
MSKPRCWADSLHNCEGKSSGEHYVSQAFFSDKTVTIKGLPWCKTEAKTIGLASATSNILCRGHNSALASLDAEIGNYMRVVRDHLHLCESRSLPRFAPFHIQYFSINARLLERWLLKVLLNLCFGGNLLLGVDGQRPGIVSPSLVDVCFGLSSFEGKAGLYVGAHEGMSLEMGETLTFSPLVHEDRRVVGGFFTVAGVYFFLCLDANGLCAPISEIPGLDPRWADTELKWRFREIKVNMNRQLSHVIRFKW